MLEAISNFLRSLLDAFVGLPDLAYRFMLNFDLDVARQDGSLRNLVIAAIIVLVAIFTYRRKDVY